MNTAILLHGNLQYAEIAKKQIPRVVERCYLPLLESLLGTEACVVFNFTGHTLEILDEQYPEAIRLIKLGLDSGRWELTATAYAHAILPLIPTTHAELQIKEDLRVKRQVLGYSPKGFFPPELAYDPTLPRLLKRLGLEWLFIDGEHLAFSEMQMNTAAPFGKKRPPSFMELLSFFERGSLVEKAIAGIQLIRLMKMMTDGNGCLPVTIHGAGAEMPAIRTWQAWYMFAGACLAGLFGQNLNRLEKRIMAAEDKRGLLLPWAFDIEFIGYREILGKTIGVARFIEFSRWLAENTPMVLPSRYLTNNNKWFPFSTTRYLKTGSWEHGKQLDLWSSDPDNARLNDLCHEAGEIIRDIPPEELYKAGVTLYNEALRHLLLAENSDGRGWVPLPERRLDCFEHALKALELARVES